MEPRHHLSPLFRGPGRVCLPHLALRPLIRPLWATPVVSNRRSVSGPRLNPERSGYDALASVSDLGVLVGQGLNLIGFVPHLTQMSLWFHRRRGLASGLVLSGASMGTLILVPGAQYLVNGYGWRLAYTVLGLLVLVLLMPLNALWQRHYPADLGLYPDGAPAPPPAVTTGSSVINGLLDLTSCDDNQAFLVSVCDGHGRWLALEHHQCASDRSYGEQWLSESTRGRSRRHDGSHAGCWEHYLG